LTLSVAQKLGVTYEEAQVELLKEKTPSRQMVLGKHIGGLAVFLCSESADQLTGQCIPIDGGWTVQ
jgi:3-hydroxybutyrate dehydrogenase